MTSPRLETLEAPDAAMPAWIRAWNRFWLKPIDPTGLGFMRICCGLLLFYMHLVYSYDLYSYIGPNSWLDAPAQNYLRKEVRVVEPSSTWTEPNGPKVENGSYLWSIYYHVHDPFWVVVIHVGILAVFLLFTVGLWTRVTAVLAWVGAMQYVERLQTNVFGVDTMLIILMLYLMIGCFFGGGTALSVDRWLERRREKRDHGARADLSLKPSWAANFAVRLVQIHFCIIYIVSGSSKLLGASWWNGTALWLCLANYNFAPMRVQLYNDFLVFLCQNRWLWELFMTSSVVFTLFTEIAFIFLVWNARWRPVMVTCSMMMHLGIGLIMGLSTFSLFMLVMVLAFVPPDQIRIWIDQWIGWGRDRLGGKKPPAVAAAAPKEAMVLTRT